MSEEIEKVVRSVRITEESSMGYIQLREPYPWYKEQRIILRNGDGSEAIIPSDLLPESQRDNGGCIDAVEAVKHLVELVRKKDMAERRLADAFDLCSSGDYSDCEHCMFEMACPDKKEIIRVAEKEVEPMTRDECFKELESIMRRLQDVHHNIRECNDKFVKENLLYSIKEAHSYVKRAIERMGYVV